MELLLETIRDLGGVRKALKGDVDYVLRRAELSGASLPPIFDALESGDEEILEEAILPYLYTSLNLKIDLAAVLKDASRRRAWTSTRSVPSASRRPTARVSA